MNPCLHMETVVKGRLKTTGDGQGHHFLGVEVDEGKLRQMRQNNGGVLTMELHEDHT